MGYDPTYNGQQANPTWPQTQHKETAGLVALPAPLSTCLAQTHRQSLKLSKASEHLTPSTQTPGRHKLPPSTVRRRLSDNGERGAGNGQRIRYRARLRESHGCDLYLKSMKLVGFKSFADRTRLGFEPGVSVVVGPNGTGKSNIVDAVAWVLGSQFTRALRTDRMDDVIFAGTATRPSHNRAEVTVVLDNRDRVLPLDLDEVSLTRRLFRGGGSEYELNGAQCRLLDVQDLLSDSGVGRSQHLIVGQGRLEPLLSRQG